MTNASWGRFVIWTEVEGDDVAVVMVKPITYRDIPSVIAELQEIMQELR